MSQLINKLVKQQLGQSMVEYTIVLVFGVMVITTGPGGDVAQQLLDVMKSNYEGYTYGISMSEAPDYDDVVTYNNELVAAGYEQDEIDRLAVTTTDVFTGLSPYNKDPLRQINAGLATLNNCMNAIPSSANQLMSGPMNCP